MKKLIITNVFLFLTLVAMACFWYFVEPRYMSTKLGFLMVFGGVAIFMAFYNTYIPLFAKHDESVSNSVFLKQLVEIQKKQLFLHTSILNVYFILLTVGICLAIFEFTTLMPPLWGIVSYVMTILWLAFNWFYLRPIVQSKQELKISLLVEKFNKMDRQLLEK